jgi:hypothetical protein
MTSHTCPLNNRSCHCDPEGIDKRKPCELARRIGRLVRMMASTYESEALVALTKLGQMLPAEGLSFNEIATLIENCDGAIEERKYSDSDAKIIFEKGMERGAENARAEAAAPPEYYDEAGQPRWVEITFFCQSKRERLRPQEQNFVDDMAGRAVWGREPTEKQGRWLLSIFVRLGGKIKR